MGRPTAAFLSVSIGSTTGSRRHRRTDLSSAGVVFNDSKVVRSTRDGYLLALDAEPGQVVWEQAAADAATGETFTMPPLFYEDLVIL